MPLNRTRDQHRITSPQVAGFSPLPEGALIAMSIQKQRMGDIATTTTSPTPLDISVVIRAYTEDRWEYLVAAIHSVYRQTQPAHEIILVVDHNQSLLKRAQASFPDIIIVENAQGPGSAGTLNTGIMSAGSMIVAFLDDDAEAQPEWLAELGRMYTDSNVIGVSGPARPRWKNGRPGWFPDEFDWVVGCTYRGLPDVVATIPNMIACNMSFRRAPLLSMPGFRADLGHMGKRPLAGDEVEFCIRVLQRLPGCRLIYNPQAWVHHNVPTKRTDLAYFLRRCYYEGQAKARVARLVSFRDGTAKERAYVRETLPRGIMVGIGDMFRKGDINGLRRALAIIVGLLATMLGFVVGTLFDTFRTSRSTVLPPLLDDSQYMAAYK